MSNSVIEKRDAKGATPLDNGAIVNAKNNFDATALLWK